MNLAQDSRPLFCGEDLRQELVILSFGKAEMLPNQIIFRAPKRNKFINTVDSLLRDPTSQLGSLSKSAKPTLWKFLCIRKSAPLFSQILQRAWLPSNVMYAHTDMLSSRQLQIQ